MPTLPSNVPVAPPPPGVHSFLVDPPDTLIHTYSIVCFLLLGISFLTVGLRLYTRAIVLRGVGADDCMCLSYVFNRLSLFFLSDMPPRASAKMR